MLWGYSFLCLDTTLLYDFFSKDVIRSKLRHSFVCFIQKRVISFHGRIVEFRRYFEIGNKVSQPVKYCCERIKLATPRQITDRNFLENRSIFDDVFSIFYPSSYCKIYGKLFFIYIISPEIDFFFRGFF